MMDKSGYAINEAIEGAERGLAELKELKSHVDNYKSIAGPKKAVVDEQQENEISQSDKKVISMMDKVKLMETSTSKD